MSATYDDWKFEHHAAVAVVCACVCVCVCVCLHMCVIPKIFGTMKSILRLFSIISGSVTCICGSKEMGITEHEIRTDEGDSNVPSLVA
jgi:hypothetical protein